MGQGSPGETKRPNPLTWRDPNTGLEWQYETPGKMTWHQAREYATSLLLDGKKGWRIPTVAELESLLDRTKARSDGRPIMREDVPFRDELPYWSSNSVHSGSAWIVHFDGAYILSYYKWNTYYVRCVRG